MTFLDLNDAWVSACMAASLCGIPIERVQSLIKGKKVRTEVIQGKKFVSLLEVEKATEGDPHDDRF